MNTYTMQPTESFDFDVDAGGEDGFIPEDDEIDTVEDITLPADTALARIDSVMATSETAFKIWVTALAEGTAKLAILVTTKNTPPRIGIHEFKIKVKNL